MSKRTKLEARATVWACKNDPGRSDYRTLIVSVGWLAGYRAAQRDARNPKPRRCALCGLRLDAAGKCPNTFT